MKQFFRTLWYGVILSCLAGCVTVHHTQTQTPPPQAAAEPRCPDGSKGLNWFPRHQNADGSWAQVEELHGSSAGAYLFVKHPTGTLVCKKTPPTAVQ